MKKNIIVTLLSTSLLVTTPVVASAQQLISRDILPYFRIDSGWSHFHKVNGVDSVPTTNSKLKSNTSAIVGAGVGLGVNFGDKVRSDITWSRHLDPKLYSDNQGSSVKRKPLIDAYFANLYYETGWELSVFHPYLGGGLGFAAVKDTITYSLATSLTSNKGNYIIRRKNNFAYKLILGSAFDLNDTIKFDLSYNYNDYGKSKNAITTTGNQVGKTHYRAHIISAGLRFGV